MTETERTEAIAAELGIEFSVALDIDYLRCLEKRIVAAAKKSPHLRDFHVYNEELEDSTSKSSWIGRNAERIQSSG